MQTVDIDNRRENSKNRDIKSQVCGEKRRHKVTSAQIINVRCKNRVAEVIQLKIIVSV